MGRFQSTLNSNERAAARRTEAAVRHQGRSERMRGKFRGFVHSSGCTTIRTGDLFNYRFREFSACVGTYPDGVQLQGPSTAARPTKISIEFAPRDTEEFKSHQNLHSNLYCEIPRNLSFSILTGWLKSPHHSGFRFAFCWPFRVSSSREQAVETVRDDRTIWYQIVTSWAQ